MTKRLLFVAVPAVIISTAFYFIFAQSRTRSDSKQQSPPASTSRLTGADPSATPPSAPAVTSTNGAKQARSPELDPVINPYASALLEPGKSKRAWDSEFLHNMAHAKSGDAIRFELTDGRMASGAVRVTQFQEGELTYIAGELVEPESGKFFFLKPPVGGKAGKAVGVVEFPASKTAYRIEPTGPNGDPELWQRRLDEVICLSLPLRDPSLDTTNATENIPPLRPGGVPDYIPSYNSNVVSLQSYPGSSAVLLLDFFGGYTPTWGGVYWPRPAVTTDQIKDLWKRVAEDYMGFNINVTTDIKVFQNAPAASRMRCVFTPNTAAMPAGAAGVAYISSWNWGNDTVCWSIYTTGKNGAEVGSHEPGHTLGLYHQGTSTLGYYAGQGSGATGWGPIMGVGYYQPVSSWAKGEYQDANNPEDELLKITTQNNNVAYRPDDTGDTLASSRYLEIYPDFAASAEGVIERTDDTDAFQFTTTGGQVLLNAKPVGDWASLAVSVTLADATDTIIASNNPQNVLYASINTVVPAGTYTFRVTGVGRNDPLINGFSSYSSIGYYSIAGYVVGARLPTRLSVVEHVPNATVVGTVTSSNPLDSHTYSISSGNTGGSFAIDNSGVITVANNTLLDFNRMATNSMLSVQFELFINITDNTNPALTEMNRRVVISLQSTALNYPIAVTGFNAGVMVPYNATVATPNATAFDLANNWGFYQAGLNGNAQVSSGGGLQGLPPSGAILSQFDSSTFQLGPYGGTNALMMGSTYPASGTLTLVTPQAYNSIAVLASSANGGGLGTMVINFTNGTQRTFNFNAPDWYNNVTNVAIQAFGRIRLGQLTLVTEDAGWNNPNLYQTTINLAVLGLNQAIGSITFTKPPVGGAHDAGVFALSGSLMPPQAIITQQPQSVTNNDPAVSATFSVTAMGAPPLAYQWYSGTPSSGTLLPGRTATNLVINPVTTNQAGNYFVVVSNASNLATSSVAALVVYSAPVITQQPAPTNINLFAGQTMNLTVTANAGIPLAYSWKFNGATIVGATTSALTRSNLKPNNTGNYSVVLSNAYGMATSTIVTLTVPAAPTYPVGQSIVADAPLGFWRLDETNGAIAHDYLHANNGTFTGVTQGQTGNNLIDTHKAARFGPGINSYVGGVPIDFATNGSATFTVECWVNGGAQSTDCGLIAKGTGGGAEQFSLDCGGSGHAFRFFVRDASGIAYAANGTIAPNSQWHHVVGVCDQPNGKVFLYVDGVSNASAAFTIGAGLLGSAKPVTFGSRQSGPSSAFDYQFNGTMEEIAIYNYALTPARIQTHYQAATNRAPVFTFSSFTKPNVNAGTAYSGTIATNATDPNGDSLTFGLVSGPTWLGVAANGNLSGSPANSDVGTNTFVVSVRDPGNLSNTATMYIFVNGSPAFSSNPLNLPATQAGQPYSGTLSPYASDPNPGDSLAFSKISGPTWLSVSSNGDLSGTPVSSDAGTNSFVVRVTDGAGLFDSTTLTIPVNDSSQAFLVTIALQGTDLVLAWSGGNPPYQVESATNIANPVWQAVGGPISTTGISLSPTNAAAFYRILGH